MTRSGSLRTLIQPAALLRPDRPRRMPTRKTGLGAQRRDEQWVTLAGVPVRLLDLDEALNSVLDRAVKGGPRPMAVASANLDHVKHFGHGNRWADTLERQSAVEWLTLLDGAPLVSQAERITHRTWPRLAGSDLILPVLDAAAEARLRIGFLGGTADVHALIRDKFAIAHPNLAVAGWWAPERSSLTDPQASLALAAEIQASGTDILVVCLGKPRQELWISEFGHLTGAKVMLAFGAVIDFLAGRVRRAPAHVRNLGLEWAWRLALEPRRLASRYLVDGPEAYIKLRRSSVAGRTDGAGDAAPLDRVAREGCDAPHTPTPASVRRFSSKDEHADVAVLVVTYNSETDIPVLLESLRSETQDQSIKVIVADNSPSPSTLSALKEHTDVFAFPTGGNVGYAAAINAAVARAGTADSYLVLNPDLRIVPGSIRVLRERMALSRAAVVVPLLLEDDGSVYPSLRREPSVSRAIGDALLGSKVPHRPGWLSETDFDPESYLHAHKIDWATGAALLIRPDINALVGEWDESYFLYSEETDFLHRVRKAGAEVWFEPGARMTHSRGGSGTSPEQDALLATNRIRYIRKFHAGGYARAFRAAVVLSAFLRSPLPRRTGVLSAVIREKAWERLPHAVRYSYPQDFAERIPTGSVIIPAHNEAAVIERTLNSLVEPFATGSVEIIVVCNGCSDGTESVARQFRGVQVLEIAEASKTAALNAGDRAARLWPRVYLDADIELPAEALYATLEQLSGNRVLCARPAFRYDTEGSSWPVRAYYRARNRLPQSSGAMWGAGVYGLSLQGHARLGKFPPVTGDDCYIDRLYGTSEKAVLECSPVTVRTPRSVRALLATLGRVYRGKAELRGMAGSRTGKTFQEVISSIHGPASSIDAAVYISFAILGRFQQSFPGHWARDESSRAC